MYYIGDCRLLVLVVYSRILCCSGAVFLFDFDTGLKSLKWTEDQPESLMSSLVGVAIFCWWFRVWYKCTVYGCNKVWFCFLVCKLLLWELLCSHSKTIRICIWATCTWYL